jgi:hypothetical protein
LFALGASGRSGSVGLRGLEREMAHCFTGRPLWTCRHPLGRHVNTADITGHVLGLLVEKMCEASFSL